MDPVDFLQKHYESLFPNKGVILSAGLMEKGIAAIKYNRILPQPRIFREIISQETKDQLYGFLEESSEGEYRFIPRQREILSLTAQGERYQGGLHHEVKSR